MKSLAILFAGLVLTACGVGSGDDAGPGAGGAVVLGQVEGALGEAAEGPFGARLIEVTVNDERRMVAVGDDLTFAVRELPTGDVSVSVGIAGIQGTLELSDVQPGENIHIAIRAGDGQLAISVERREPGEAPVVEVEPADHRGPVVIDARHAVYRFEPGVYDGDVIVRGDHVTLLGAPNPGCEADGGTTILGDLQVDGKHVKVIDLDVRGASFIHGKHVEVFNGCGQDDRHDGRDDADDRHDEGGRHHDD